jgi:DNA-binding MarR family transcriptional regulator
MPRLLLTNWLPFRLSALANRVREALYEYYHPRYGLSVTAWRVVANLGERPTGAHLSAKALAERVMMDQVQISRAIREVVRLGVVRRSVDGSDRRRAAIELTPHGRRVYESIVPVALRLERELMNQLSPAEQRRLSTLLDRLDRAVLGASPGSSSGAGDRRNRSPARRVSGTRS